MKVILAQPRGFCAGVERAIEIVEKALERYGPPVYVRHEIVHNKRVVQELTAKGARFVEELDEIPDGAITVFSAHGVAQSVEDTAADRSLPVLDATCPLVAKVHKEGQRYAEKGFEVVLIGHEGHPEVVGTMGRIPGVVHLVQDTGDVATLVPANPDKLAYVTQTTLSVDDTREVIEALKARFPSIAGPDVKDICYATQNRQAAVRKLSETVDLILVVGARNSSNSNRLRELGGEDGTPSYLVEEVAAVDPGWFEGVGAVGVTAGASTPEHLVDEVIDRLRAVAPVELSIMDGIEEHIRFKLPEQLRAALSGRGSPAGSGGRGRSRQASGQCPHGRLGRFVQNSEQGPGGAGRTALSLLPVADRFLRHVDTPRELKLRKPETLAHAAGVSRHILRRRLVVATLLQRDIPFRRPVQNFVVDPSVRQALRPFGINPDARLAHIPEPPFRLPCGRK